MATVCGEVSTAIHNGNRVCAYLAESTVIWFLWNNSNLFYLHHPVSSLCADTVQIDSLALLERDHELLTILIQQASLSC